MHHLHSLPIAIALALTTPLAALAENTAASGNSDDDIFTLGQLTVTGKRPEALATGDSTITREEMWTFNTLVDKWATKRHRI